MRPGWVDGFARLRDALSAANRPFIPLQPHTTMIAHVALTLNLDQPAAASRKTAPGPLVGEIGERSGLGRLAAIGSRSPSAQARRPFGAGRLTTSQRTCSEAICFRSSVTMSLCDRSLTSIPVSAVKYSKDASALFPWLTASPVTTYRGPTSAALAFGHPSAMITTCKAQNVRASRIMIGGV